MSTSTKNRIVVGFDGSPDAECALTWAIRTSIRAGQAIVVIVVTATDDLAPGHAVPRAGEIRDVRAVAERLIADALLDEVIVETRPGGVVQVLLEAAEGAAMVVVGSCGHGQLSGALMGSVSQHVARHAPCPVVVVRPARNPGAQRIIVGVDGSGGSDAAVEFACNRAELTGEEIVLVHGWSDGSATGTTRREVPMPFVERIADEERLLAEAIAGVRADHPDLSIDCEAVPVAAWRALVDASTEATLVVVGSRGRGAFAGMLLGSVSQHVMQHAECPVAIVR